jgi:hypothetical protein
LNLSWLTMNSRAAIGEPIAEIFRIADGQIVEVWVYPNTLSIMQQFGVIPTSGSA